MANSALEDVPPRRGACSDVDQENGKAYIFRGYNDRHSELRHIREGYEQYITSYDFDTKIRTEEYFDEACSKDSPSFSIGACCAIIDKKLIVFGGWDHGYLHNEVHQLDLCTNKWAELSPAQNGNAPILKNKARMVPYGPDMVFVFGGYGYPLRGRPLQKDAAYDWDRSVGPGLDIGWTNEQHLFHVKDRVWIVPETTGVRPPPCAAFSLNRIDPFRVVLFGGRQKAERVHDVHILDMASWVSSTHQTYVLFQACLLP